jgi:hypothetical protein
MSQRVIVPTPQELSDAIGVFSTTPNGLPYPESTDQLSQGANAIKALALAVDSWLKVSPMLWVYRMISVAAAPAVYKYQAVNTDTASGWDAVNARYAVSRTGTYLAIVKSQMDGYGGSSCPGIQVAPTVSGTYVTKFGTAVTGTSAYMGNFLSAVMPLTAGNGVRVVELAGTGWTGDQGSDGSNFFQLAYIGG